MLQSGCINAWTTAAGLTAAQVGYVTLSGSAGSYSLKQSHSVSGGYSITACIKCINSEAPAGVKYDNWVFSTPDCSNHITAAASQKSAHTVAYVEGGPVTIIATGWSDGIFKNPLASTCGAITACTI